MGEVAASSAQGEPTPSHGSPTASAPTGTIGASSPHAEVVTGRTRAIVACVLIVFVGVNLRSVILAVPPVLPLIQHDLGLSYTETGLLTAVPLLLMAGFALPSGLLAGRLGGRRIVGLGLILLAVGSVLRSLWPAALPLYLFTVVLSLGISLSQTAVPVLARQWFPTRIGLVTALFSDGLILGETVGAAFTLPLMNRFFAPDGWAGALLLWAWPALVAVALWLLFAPPAAATVPARSNATTATTATTATIATTASPSPAAPRRVNALQLGLLLGGGSLVYFGMNAWIAPYNHAIGATAATPLVLGVLNAIQLPVGLTVTLFADHLAGRRWPFVGAGVFCLVAVVGWVVSPIGWQPFWAGCLGSGSSFVFVLGIALPALLADRASVARLAGATLMVSYGVAFAGPLLGGLLWDLTHQPWLAFVPVGIAALDLIVLGGTLPSRANFGLVDERYSAT